MMIIIFYEMNLLLIFMVFFPIYSSDLLLTKISAFMLVIFFISDHAEDNAIRFYDVTQVDAKVKNKTDCLQGIVVILCMLAIQNNVLVGFKKMQING